MISLMGFVTWHKQHNVEKSLGIYMNAGEDTITLDTGQKTKGKRRQYLIYMRAEQTIGNRQERHSGRTRQD